MSSRRGICPKCFRIGVKLTDHHVFPNRWARRQDNGDTKLYLCWECHTEIDRMLPPNRKLTREECLEITKKWLQGKDVWVY